MLITHTEHPDTEQLFILYIFCRINVCSGGNRTDALHYTTSAITASEADILPNFVQGSQIGQKLGLVLVYSSPDAPRGSFCSDLQVLLEAVAAEKNSKGSYSGEYPSSPRDGYNGVKAGGGGGGGAGGGRFSLGGYGADACPMGDAAYSAGSTASNYESSAHPPIRETGIIEKLLHSYGFIQCCERQARLFFHFSQFSGNTEHLKIGDPVEFEMTYDRRTGKPIASTVTKIAPEVVLSEARVTGTVTTEVKGEGSGDNTGRISYENRGECFFLPYTKDDVEGNVVLRTGDAVSFQIATNQRGTLGACHVRFENPQHPVKYHGVVCSMKENFGFIERADVVKEIFFHYSEAKTDEELMLGDDVEFLIQTRNGKEVACNISKLPGGSVVFEDVSPDTLRGQVLKPLERGAAAGGAAPRQSDPLPGRIRYRAPDHSEVEVPFGDKDQCGEFTLRHGDWVRFQVATDRRDRLRRATNIALLDESFSVSGERRERGVVRSLRDGFGYLRCVERDRPMLFRFAEVLRLGRELSVGDEVEFTVDPPATFGKSDTRQAAIRIKHLPAGSVAFETLVERALRGTVSEVNRPPDERRAESPARDYDGLLVAHLDQAKKTLPFRTKRGEPRQPRLGDKVVFDLYQVKRTKELVALGVQVAGGGGGGGGGGGAADPLANGTPRAPAHGYIAALKDGFGFIETADHSREVFFHFSNLEGAAESLELGAEVEYAVGRGGGGGGGCASAEWVRALPRGSLPQPRAAEPPLTGVVTRTLRALNPDQPQYCGLVQADSGGAHEFGITGLACKREILQVGDPVTFQVDAEGRAANIVPVRKKRRALVDAIKGGFGFLSLAGAGAVEEASGGGGGGEARRLFFHMSEVRGAAADLQPGDTVEFVMLTNPRNGKSSACNVVKIPRAVSKARPERLLARLRTASLEEGGAPRVVAVRAPRGPDGTRGFRPRRARAD